MTLLGAMWAGNSNFSGGLLARLGGVAAAVGAGLSLTAVLCVLRRSARHYSAVPGSHDGIDAGRACPPAGTGSAVPMGRAPRAWRGRHPWPQTAPAL